MSKRRGIVVVVVVRIGSVEVDDVDNETTGIEVEDEEEEAVADTATADVEGMVGADELVVSDDSPAEPADPPLATDRGPSTRSEPLRAANSPITAPKTITFITTMNGSIRPNRRGATPGLSPSVARSALEPAFLIRAPPLIVVAPVPSHNVAHLHQLATFAVERRDLWGAVDYGVYVPRNAN